MLYASMAQVPQALRATCGLYTFPGGVWVTPPNRIVDGAALLPLSRANTTQADGQTVAVGSPIGSAISKLGDIVILTVTALDQLTAGALRSQVNFTNRLLVAGGRYVLSCCVRLPPDWDATGPDLLLLQAKDTPDTHLGETGRNPPVAVYVMGNQFAMQTRNDAAQLSAGNVAPNATLTAPLVINGWVTLSAVFELGRGASGRAEFWVNRVKVGESAAPVGYNDIQGIGANYAVYCYAGLGLLMQRQASFKGLMVHAGSTTVGEVCDAFDSHPGA